VNLQDSSAQVTYSSPIPEAFTFCKSQLSKALSDSFPPSFPWPCRSYPQQLSIPGCRVCHLTTQAIYKMNVQQQRDIVWSRIPDLNLGGTNRRRPNRRYRLSEAQVLAWVNFEREVRRGTVPTLGQPVNFVYPPLPIQYYVVARESGVSARIVQNVFEALGPVFNTQNRMSGSETSSQGQPWPGIANALHTQMQF